MFAEQVNEVLAWLWNGGDILISMLIILCVVGVIRSFRSDRRRHDAGGGAIHPLSHDDFGGGDGGGDSGGDGC